MHTFAQGLAGLFQAPAALMFQGTFEEAKAKAVEEGKWLVSSSSAKPIFRLFLLSGNMPVEASLVGSSKLHVSVWASVSICIGQHTHLPAPMSASMHICQCQHGVQACF